MSRQSGTACFLPCFLLVLLVPFPAGAPSAPQIPSNKSSPPRTLLRGLSIPTSEVPPPWSTAPPMEQRLSAAGTNALQLHAWLSHPTWTTPSWGMERVPILLANKLDLWRTVGGFEFRTIRINVLGDGIMAAVETEEGAMVGEIGLFPFLRVAQDWTKNDRPIRPFSAKLVGSSFLQRLEHYLVFKHNRYWGTRPWQRPHSAHGILAHLWGKKVGVASHKLFEETFLFESLVGRQHVNIKVAPRGFLEAVDRGGTTPRSLKQVPSAEVAENKDSTTIVPTKNMLCPREHDVALLVDLLAMRQDQRYDLTPVNIVPLGSSTQIGYGENGRVLDDGVIPAGVDAGLLTEPALSATVSESPRAERGDHVRILARLGDFLPVVQWSGLFASDLGFLESPQGRVILERILKVYKTAVLIIHNAVVVHTSEKSPPDDHLDALLALGPEHFGVSRRTMLQALRRTSGYFEQWPQHRQSWQTDWRNFDRSGAVECLKMVRAVESVERQPWSSVAEDFRFVESVFEGELEKPKAKL